MVSEVHKIKMNVSKTFIMNHKGYFWEFVFQATFAQVAKREPFCNNTFIIPSIILNPINFKLSQLQGGGISHINFFEF